MGNIDLEADNGLRLLVALPKVVKSPVFPKLSTTMVMALAGGLLFGLALIYVMDTLDDRFRSPDEIQRQLGHPILAMIRQMPDCPAPAWTP